MFIDKLIEASKKVYEQLGYGLNELVYEKALQIELNSIDNFRCDNEIYTNLFYEKGDDKYFLTSLRIDILVERPVKAIIELKTIKGTLKKDDKEYFQAKRYQKLMNTDECYLVNFGLKGLEVYDCNVEEFNNLAINVVEIDV